MAANKWKWNKILYADQGVPDDFVDDSFLEELKKNLYTRTYKYWPVVRESGVVTQQLSSVCLFVVAFIYMQRGTLLPHYLFICSLSLASIAYVASETIAKNTHRTRFADVKTVVMVLAFGYSLSPVFMTLTDTISTDTIYTMTFFMLLANLLFHDYGASAALVSQAISLNAAIFASVCLASRLPSTWHAFATVTVAIETFALWPMFRRKLKSHIAYSQDVMTIVLGVSASVAIASVSWLSGLLFILVHVFISFICPAWLITLQPCKQTIHGPWDEAVIKD